MTYLINESIEIDFIGFWPSLDKEKNFFTDLLRQYFDIVINENPDGTKPHFLFCSVFRDKKNILDYPNSTTIYYTGENTRANLKKFDYALSFDFIIENNRHFRLPIYRMYAEYDQALALKKINNPQILSDLLESKDKFCNFIYSNGKAFPERKYFLDKLNKYKSVHSAGKYLNNTGAYLEDKIAFQKSCKFSIAFENSCYEGYTTEKLLHALVSKTIPIYWGNPLVNVDFNPKAFINVYNYNSFDDVVELVREIDQNDKMYLNYIKEPPFLENQSSQLCDDKIIDFFYKVFTSPKVNKFYKKKAYLTPPKLIPLFYYNKEVLSFYISSLGFMLASLNIAVMFWNIILDKLRRKF